MSKQPLTFEDIIQKAKDSWPGPIGEERAKSVAQVIRKAQAQYLHFFDIQPDEAIAIWESQRNVNVPNWYQECNYPDLNQITIYDNQAAMLEAFGKQGFRCPNCKEATFNPYECEHCDWKTYGLFRIGLHTFTIREGFKEKPVIDRVFIPVALEQS